MVLLWMVLGGGVGTFVVLLLAMLALGDAPPAVHGTVAGVGTLLGLVAGGSLGLALEQRT